MNESLMARLGLDTSGFKAGLNTANADFLSFAKNAAASFGAAGGVAVVERLVSSAVEYGAKIYDLGKRFNVSTDSIQKWGNAAELVGLDLESMTMGFNKLEISSSRALAGQQQQIDAFAHLGVTVADLKSLSPEEILTKIGSSSMGAADMVAVFGKTALSLRPVLEQVADGTIKLGNAIDKNVIKKLKEADDELKKFGQELTILGGALVGQGMGATHVYLEYSRQWLKAFNTVKEAGVGAWEIIMSKQSSGIDSGIERVKHSMDAFKDMSGASGSADASAAYRRLHTEVPKSSSELGKEKKDRERDQLSLKELQDEGPLAFGGGTMEAVSNAQKARQVADIEKQIKLINLTGISPTGEKIGKSRDAFGKEIEGTGLRSRADTIRQSISTLKESEKEVGGFRTAIDTSKMAKDIADIKDNLNFGDLDM